MYLLETIIYQNNYTTPNLVQIGSKPPLSTIKNNTTTTLDNLNGESSFIEESWVRYTVIAACILIILIIIVVLYDIISRCRSLRGQEIFDGGPPASPNHQHFYLITVAVDEASSTFDIKQSSIRIEILDNFNQYLTSILIPCFIFKFKNIINSNGSQYSTNNNNNNNNNNTANLQKSTEQTATTIQNINNNNINHNSKLTNSSGGGGGAAGGYSSLTAFYENWTNIKKSQTIHFKLIRRNPLNNISSIRLSHDCFKQNAYITFKHIIIQNNLSYETYRIDLENKQIKGIQPCPPTGVQVFKVQSAS